MTPAIVVLGYNRIKSISRLLKSLAGAYYPAGISVPLIIDLDNCGSDEIYKACCEFEWNHGEKKVVLRPERMGLREHVLDCGDLSYEYGSIVMFEDDMLVSPMFYSYACEALDFCEKDDRVGGVSLYNHLYNVHARRSFTAIDDGYDNWYFQFASSWGQAYTGEQWKLFRKWYEEHKDADLKSLSVPDNVSSWSQKSWLKYHICYLIDTDKYFMYPRVGYSTNCGDAGSHFARANTDLQIPMGCVGMMSGSKNMDSGSKSGENRNRITNDSNSCIAGRFRFSTLEESGSVYDAFFENRRLGETDLDREGIDSAATEPTAPGKDTLIDLYGLKDITGILKENPEIKRVLTSKHLPYKVIRSYGRYMRPLDANIYYEMEGSDFYLYDVTGTAGAPSANDEAAEYLYEYRGISADQMKKIIGYRIREKFQK